MTNDVRLHRIFGWSNDVGIFFGERYKDRHIIWKSSEGCFR